MAEKTFVSGYAALIGRPNVGKSTLMNRVLDIKLSIVTPKPQTTRHRVLGIYNEEHSQIIFLDTPGLLTPRYKLHEIMVKTVWTAVEDADVILYMIDAENRSHEKDFALLSSLTSGNKPVLLIINKSDAIGKENLLPIIQAYQDAMNFTEIIPISALHGDGVELVIECIRSHLPEMPPYYPPDVLTEQPERFFVAEIIREKIFQKYKDEIPYSTTVSIEEFKERDENKDYIRATIYVERSSQKGILIGKKGAALKSLGRIARSDIESFLEREVYLDLHVSVKDKWRFRDGSLKDLGYK